MRQRDREAERQRDRETEREREREGDEGWREGRHGADSEELEIVGSKGGTGRDSPANECHLIESGQDMDSGSGYLYLKS
eukprot:3940649-Rhodomonas_salina.1